MEKLQQHSFRPATVGVAVCAIALLAVASASAHVTTGPVNKADFQAIVDALDEGDTILCKGGEYDFSDSGDVLITKGMRIKAKNPADPPVFVGSGNFDTPILDGNNAFTVPPDAVVYDLKFRNLHFREFDRAISVVPGVDSSEPGCPDAGGDVTKVRVVGNDIRTGRRGVEFFGHVHDFVVKLNTINVSSIPVLVQGGGVGCPDPSGVVPSERPHDGLIANNELIHEFVGIRIDGGEHVDITANQITGGILGIWFGDQKASYFPDDGPIDIGAVKNNVIETDIWGIVAFGPTTLEKTPIARNSISGALAGILIDLGGNGFRISQNLFDSIGVAEVWLGFDEPSDPLGAEPPDSHDNRVIVFAGNRVEDFGVDNVVRVKAPACPCEGLSFGSTTWDTTFTPANFPVCSSSDFSGGLVYRDGTASSQNLIETTQSRCFLVDETGAQNNIFDLTSEQKAACSASIRAIAADDGIVCP